MLNRIVYKAENLKTHKLYIGQTTILEKRKKRHKYLAFDQYSSSHFHRALRKYGWDSFNWMLLENGLTEEEANILEMYWITYYRGLNKSKVLNMTDGGDGIINPCQDTREKLRIASVGRVFSEESKEKMRLAKLGNTLSKEHKQKIAVANTGKHWVCSEQAKENMSIAKIGCIRTEETKKKISDSVTGVKNPFYGKRHSKETKKKMSDAANGRTSGMLGKKHSENAKRKMSESSKGQIAWNKGMRFPVKKK